MDTGFADVIARSEELAERLRSVPPGRSGKGRPANGLGSAAAVLGVPKVTAHRAMLIASLSPTAKATAREVGLASNQTVLLDAAGEASPAAQVKALKDRAPVPAAPGAIDQRVTLSSKQVKRAVEALTRVEDIITAMEGLNVHWQVREALYKTSALARVCAHWPVLTKAESKAFLRHVQTERAP